MVMQDNLIFQKVKDAYLAYLNDLAGYEEEGSWEYWVGSKIRALRTPEELIAYALYDLHTDPKNSMMELYKIMANIISLNDEE